MIVNPVLQENTVSLDKIPLLVLEVIIALNTLTNQLNSLAQPVPLML